MNDMEWYHHYMNIDAGDLLAEYASCKVRDSREVTVALQQAFEARHDEMDDYRIEVVER